MFRALGDGSRRAIVERLAPAPGISFPMACRGAAELEGCYRLLSNPKVEWADVLAPHLEQTLAIDPHLVMRGSADLSPGAITAGVRARSAVASVCSPIR